MQSSDRLIATSFTLSALLHAVAFVVLFVLVDLTAVAKNSAIGQGLNIQLISSDHVSDQFETEVAGKQSVEKDLLQEIFPEKVVTEKKIAEIIQKAATAKMRVQHQHVVEMLTVVDNSSNITSLPVTENTLDEVEHLDVSDYVVQNKGSIDDSNQSATVTQSTNTMNQQQAILALLHERISSNKKYPYIAKRQRREGIATISFVLHPDGSIKDTHLVVSSSAGVLDRAALNAVKMIEPFRPAHNYLEHAEAFKVDVVFKLL